MARLSALSTKITRRALYAGTALSGALLSLAHAAPQGGQIVAGQAQIRQVSPNEIDITQKSARLVLDWASFGLAAGETVRFIQGANEVALNEIAGGASVINGNLFADARLILVNPAGLTFGAPAHVQVGSLVATTANIAVPDFLNDRYAFTQAGQSTATITNKGSITATQGGLVALVAPGVANSGVITARFGKVALASGSSFFLDLYGDHLVNLVVGGGQVASNGQIIAEGGRVQLSAAAASGLVSGAVNLSGVVEARAITVEGGRVTLDAAGRIDADGVGMGNGGHIAIEATDSATLAGTLTARGGALGGDGGFIETSAPNGLVFGTTAPDASAAHGAAGTWLIDPEAVVIAATTGTPTPGTTTLSTSMVINALKNNDVVIETNVSGTTGTGSITVESALLYGRQHSLLLLAQGAVTVDASIQNTLAVGGGGVALVAGWDGVSGGLAATSMPLVTQGMSVGGIVAAIQAAHGFGAPGGEVLIGGLASASGVAVGSLSGPVTVLGHDISLQGGTGTNAFAQIGFDPVAVGMNTLVSATGSIALALTGNLLLAGGTSSTGSGAFAQIGDGGVSIALRASGGIMVSAPSGSVVLQGGGGAQDYAQIGHGGFAADQRVTGAFSLAGAITLAVGGDVTLAGGNGGSDAYAQIGHGGDHAFSSAILTGASGNFGAISLQAGGNLTLAGGSGGENYAQLGLGGFELGFGARSSGGSLVDSGAITVGAASVRLQGGGSNGNLDAYAQIGHGGGGAFESAKLAGASGDFGAISLAVLAGSLILAAGNDDSYAQLGHGGLFFGSSTMASGSLVNSGAITVAAASILVQGSSNTFIVDSYAQIGHGGDFAFSSGTSSVTLAGASGDFGAISLTAFGGDLTLTGGGAGGGARDYAQIGHGGLSFGESATVSGGSLVNSGAITVGAVNVSLQGGGTSATQSYAQLGHGGFEAFDGAMLTGADGNFGAISLQAGGNLTLAGSTNYAQLGHGGLGFGFLASSSGGSLVNSGAITVAAASVFLQGGNSRTIAATYAQLGHGGAGAFEEAVLTGSSGNFGAISLTAGGGGLTLAGGAGAGSAYAQLGHGGLVSGDDATLIGSGASLVNSGAIAVTAASVFLQGGTSSSDAYAQLGHGGDNAFAAAKLTGASGDFGAISLAALGGSLTLAAGSGAAAYAQLGHGGFEFGRKAREIGSGGSLVNSGAITVAAVSVSLFGGGTAVVTGGTTTFTSDGYAQIGHGGDQAFSGATLSGTLGSGDFGAISLTASEGGLTAMAGSGTNAYAQLGHGGDVAFSQATLTGASGNFGAIGLVASEGSLTLAAGNGNQAYAQLGHGGFGFGSAVTSRGSLVDSGAITVAAASVLLRGGGTSSSDAYAQIGHGGDQAFSGATLGGTLSNGDFGAISLTASEGGLTVMAGSGANAYAQLGHGGLLLGESAGMSGGSLVNSGAITVGAASVLLQGGGTSSSNNPAYAQIGHGGLGFGLRARSSGGSLVNSGAISLAALGGSLILAAGAGTGSYAQLGHGGFEFGESAMVSGGSLVDSGAITAAAASVSLQGGGTSAGDAYAQIGHGGDNAFSHAGLAGASGNFGAISLAIDGDLALAGGGGIIDYAQIGHGGFEFGDGAMVSGRGGSLVDSGAITLGAASVNLQGSSGSGAYAQIGHGGDFAFGNAALMGASGNFGAIGLSALGGELTLAAGSGGNAYAQFGHGGFAFGDGATMRGSGGSLVDSGAITVRAASVSLQGDGSAGVAGEGAYAQLGHGGDGAFSGATLTGASGNFGAISLTALGGALSLAAGAGSQGYAQLGHGGFGFGGGATVSGSGGSLVDSGAITVTAASVSLRGGIGTAFVSGGTTEATSDGYAQIGHGGDQAFSSATLSGTLGSGDFGAIGLTVVGGVALTGGSGSRDYAQIGQGGALWGQSATVSHGSLSNSGAITVGAASVSLMGGTGINFLNGTTPEATSEGYAQIGHGGDQAFSSVTLSGTLGNGDFGVIGLQVGGALALAGGNGSTDYAQIGHGGFHFGSGGSGSLVDSGAIAVAAASASLQGGALVSDAYAQLGHGAADGTARGMTAGTVDVRVLGTLALTNGGSGNSPAFIGNRAASLATGSGVLVLAGALSDDGVTGIGTALAQSIAADLAGGAVTVAVRGVADVTVGAAIGGTSGNQLNLVTAGNLLVDGTIGNGSGKVILLTGWDGHSGVPALANAAFTIAQAASAVPEKAVMLAGTVTTSGGAVTALGAVVVSGAGAIDTTDGGGASGAAITLGRVGDASFEGGSLRLRAGTGNVVLGGGAGLRLGPLTIVSAGNVSLGAVLAVETLSITAAGAVTGSIDTENTVMLSAGTAVLTGEAPGFTGMVKGVFTFNGVLEK